MEQKVDLQAVLTLIKYCLRTLDKSEQDKVYNEFSRMVLGLVEEE